MRILFELLLLIGMVLALPAIPIALGHLRHRARFPEDTRLFGIYIRRARSAPDSFRVENGNSVEAKDDIFTASDRGNLQAERRLINLSMWQDMQVARSVKRLWKYHGRTDAKKKKTLEKLSAHG